jgi:hypothetical protein
VGGIRDGGGWPRYPLRRGDLVVALVVALGALSARAPFIVRGRTLLHSDEAVVGLMAQDIAAGERFPIFFYGQRYMGALEAYVIAACNGVMTDPVLALRLGPALFFAALTAVQYLMLTRWFGRSGLVGALTLLAASPMFVQWSIAARGGYIEVLLWGTLLWWAYSEWFVPPAPATHRATRQALFGILIGSGYWINPMFLGFLAPVVLHALLDAPLARARGDGRLGPWLAVVDRAGLGLPVALPAAIVGALIVLSAFLAVEVGATGVRLVFLFGLVPPPVAAVVEGGLLGAAGVVLVRWPGLIAGLRGRVVAAGPMIFGLVVGLTPVLLYILGRTLTGRPLEGMVAMGPRPPWRVVTSGVYLWRGLPLLFGADPMPFLRLVQMGKPWATKPLGPEIGRLLGDLNGVVLGGLAVVGVLWVRRYGGELASALRLRPAVYGPAPFLVLAAATLIVMYLMTGAAFDFTTIRYLVSLWAVVPGLLASVAARPSAVGARLAVAVPLLAWGAGQVGLWAQVGGPHPLERLAERLRREPQDVAVAEIFDAHQLTFWTRQHPPVLEFEPFWPRLAHLRPPRDRGRGPVRYLVQVSDHDWAGDWDRAGFPGQAPVETRRSLWPRLRRLSAEHPEQVLARQTLPDGYELWTLRAPLPEPD